MASLTYGIAQKIVDQTMKILKLNINVMNEYGVIIGSGDRNRIGQIHAAALQVIEKKERVDIGIGEEEKLTGTKPGINLPIVYEDRVVGVIGISGNPDEISQFGELVKMGAELTLKQAALAEQLQWDYRLREELVNEMIHHKMDPLSMERANRLGINLYTSRIPIMLKFIPDAIGEEPISTWKKSILSYLHRNLDKEDLVSSTGSTEIIILKNNASEKAKNYLLNEVEQLIKILEHREEIRFKAGIGISYTKLEEVHTSYQYAKDALKVGEVLYPDMKVYDCEELLLPIHFSYFSLPNNKLLQSYRLLANYDKKAELQTTLQIYIEEDGSLNETAKRLYIHRNTLRYRLEKIREVTGKDPRKIKSLFELYISQLLYKLM